MVLRALVALLSVTSVVSQSDQATCALDGVRAVDDVMDAVVYTMSSMARCSTTSGAGDTTNCIVDVAQVIESVNKMVHVILKAVDKCGAITSDNPECGLSVTVLTKSVAKLTAAGAGIVAKCPNAAHNGWGMTKANDGSFSKTCEVNIKDSIKSLLKAIKRSVSLKDDCKEPGSMECAHNAIKLTNAMVGVAEYVSGAVNKCSGVVGDVANAGCAQMSTKLVHATGLVASASTSLAQNCQPSPTDRLYLASVDAEEDAATPQAVRSPTIDVSGRFLAATTILAIGLMATMVVFKMGNKNRARVSYVRTAPEDYTHEFTDVEE